MPSAISTLPPRLNLPAAPLSLRSGTKGVEVRDVLRNKWVVVTPEEWVRQHFVHYLAGVLRYPCSRMANEMAVTLNGVTRRCDTIVFGNDLRPLMIVEYKAPSVKIGQRVLDQAARYNVVLDVPYLVLSNGMEHYCFRVEKRKVGSAPTCVICPLPSYEDLVSV